MLQAFAAVWSPAACGRGLKRFTRTRCTSTLRVARRVRAWIETFCIGQFFSRNRVARRVRAWIETLYQDPLDVHATVARRVRAWIETASG